MSSEPVVDPAALAVPAHLAIIMDGNGRWARQRHLPRAAGHRAGVKTIKRVADACEEMGVRVLTVYAFSTENWNRPRSEVDHLMRLYQRTLDAEVADLHRRGIRVLITGRLHELPPGLRERAQAAMELTAGNPGGIINVALNYGGRAEIVDACRAVVRRGLGPEEIDEAALSAEMYTAGLPDPDLIIRTAGESRISNFLLWQAAYAEIVVTPTLWPDFDREHLLLALGEYSRRIRRFGGLTPADLPARDRIAR